MREEIEKYITIPFAIKLFREDQEIFKNYKVGHVYMDKLDAVIDDLQQDFYKLKGTFNNVRKIGDCKYSFKEEVIEFSPSELRSMTGDVMREYLYGDKATDFERKERIWSNN